MPSLLTGSVSIKPYPASAYLTQLVVRVLRQRKKLTEDIVQKVYAWAEQEIGKQITLIQAESKSADVFQLAYAVLLKASLKDQSKWQPEDNKIAQAALDLFFSAQLKDGTWPRSQPLFHYPEVGDAHCFEYETLVQLLEERNLKEFVPHYLTQTV